MISIVVPCRNEALSLATLAREIRAVCAEHGYEYEIIFVDDGSDDATWSEIARIAAAEPRTRALRLRRNYGKGPALCAGFDSARGPIIVTMDADLQDDPRDIP